MQSQKYKGLCTQYGLKYFSSQWELWKMGGTAKMNAMRSTVVVIGALAFGYLSMHLGFKPYLERAQLEQQRREALLLDQSEDGFDDSFRTAGGAIPSDRFPESDHKL